MSKEGKDGLRILMGRLGQLDDIAERGYAASINVQGDLLVCRRGHWRGMWRYSEGVYNWIVAGSRASSYETNCIEDAVAFTVQNVLVE